MINEIILTGDRLAGCRFVEKCVLLQNSNRFHKIYIMIVNVQALTDNAEHLEKNRQNILQVALDYLACRIDPEASTTFIQSMISE